jgi:hypothetical protein
MRGLPRGGCHSRAFAPFTATRRTRLQRSAMIGAAGFLPFYSPPARTLCEPGRAGALHTPNGEQTGKPSLNRRLCHGRIADENSSSLPRLACPGVASLLLKRPAFRAFYWTYELILYNFQRPICRFVFPRPRTVSQPRWRVAPHKKTSAQSSLSGSSTRYAPAPWPLWPRLLPKGVWRLLCS